MTEIATGPGAAASGSPIPLLYAARGVRGFGDGFAIIILPAYLSAIGYDPVAIGFVATASLLGTALLTLASASSPPVTTCARCCCSARR